MDIELIIRKVKGKNMKRYFVEGKEITEAEAKEIKENNDKYFSRGNMDDLLKIKFIVEV